MTTTTQKPPFKDRIIPWYFVMAFAVVFAVNAVFVTVALKTHPGVTEKHTYEKGLAYNQTLALAEAQEELGWRVEFDLVEGNILRLEAKNKTGQALTNAQVNAKIMRPVQDGYDFEVALVARKNGIYEAPLTLPLPGLWNVRVFIEQDGRSYQKSREIIIE